MEAGNARLPKYVEKQEKLVQKRLVLSCNFLYHSKITLILALLKHLTTVSTTVSLLSTVPI